MGYQMIVGISGLAVYLSCFCEAKSVCTARKSDMFFLNLILFPAADGADIVFFFHGSLTAASAFYLHIRTSVTVVPNI